jgi:hypothetical protein
MREQTPEEDLKPCRYCGRLTSTKANFCYYCGRELVARPERPAEEPRPARINWVAVAVVVVVVLAIIIFLATR